MMRRPPKHLKENPTDAEQRLWAALRNSKLGDYKFRRQQPLGSYVVDFCCWEKRGVVEADGVLHVILTTLTAQPLSQREREGP